MNSPFDDHIKTDVAPLYVKRSPGADGKDPKLLDLLWGDGVVVLEQGPARTKVRARGRRRTGWIPNECLGGKSLLEYYYIDVGQGDGVLIKTPDFQHILIDGGWPRRSQDTGKNAADFVDWKFFQDYGMDHIELDVMICSHNDQDHYGGLWDLLNPELSSELDAEEVFVKDFYHAGLAWWRNGDVRTLGPSEESGGEEFFVRLLGDRTSVESAVGGNGPQLQGEWAQFMQRVTEAKWKDGQPTAIQRLSHMTGLLPGFEQKSASTPEIHVLAPVEFDVNGVSGIRRYPQNDSKSTNGNSVMLRLDFGRTRTLLTGDLNTYSQQALLKDYAGETDEFACDVAKACHHGSDDVSYSFLEKMCPAVTVISSGDNEGHDHPRPSIVAASATTGYFKKAKDKLVSPLVFSTELARSVSFGRPSKLDLKDDSGQVVQSLEEQDLGKAILEFKETKSGARSAKTKSRSLRGTKVVAGLIYGLVNVRTDGRKILCATLDEADHEWRIHKIQSRF